MDKSFYRARHGHNIDVLNKLERIKTKYPHFIELGILWENENSHRTAAASQKIDFQIYIGRIWFKTEEDMNATRICL